MKNQAPKKRGPSVHTTSAYGGNLHISYSTETPPEDPNKNKRRKKQAKCVEKENLLPSIKDKKLPPGTKLNLNPWKQECKVPKEAVSYLDKYLKPAPHQLPDINDSNGYASHSMGKIRAKPQIITYEAIGNGENLQLPPVNNNKPSSSPRSQLPPVDTEMCISPTSPVMRVKKNKAAAPSSPVMPAKNNKTSASPDSPVKQARFQYSPDKHTTEGYAVSLEGICNTPYPSLVLPNRPGLFMSPEELKPNCDMEPLVVTGTVLSPEYLKAVSETPHEPPETGTVLSPEYLKAISGTPHQPLSTAKNVSHLSKSSINLISAVGHVPHPPKSPKPSASDNVRDSKVVSPHRHRIQRHAQHKEANLKPSLIGVRLPPLSYENREY
ncbi:hypothetical protein ScPMuIL_008402 [Solemya velum]